MRPWVKLCGMRTVADVEAAVAAGADAVGFVLASHSIRHVDEAVLEQLLEAVPPGILSVAVTADPSGVLDLVERLPVDVLQGHATFTGDTPVPFWPVFLDGADLAQRVDADPRRGPWGTVLVDGAGGGGRGEPADWDRIAALSVPVCLAGGLSPDNVAEAIRRVRPVAVDVCSGIEATRGVKDPARMRAFVDATRS